MNQMTHPLPKFKVGKTYVAERATHVPYVQFVTCLSVEPLVLRPDGSSLAFSLEHFNWVIDRPKSNT